MEIKELINEFEKRFGSGGEIRIFQSPGRVNLIGEHTDYNGGYVFPAALTMRTAIAYRRRNDNTIKMMATDLEDVVEADINNLGGYKDLWWGNYQIGIADVMKKKGYEIVGCDMLFDDTTPHGGGLSVYRNANHVGLVQYSEEPVLRIAAGEHFSEWYFGVHSYLTV